METGNLIRETTQKYCGVFRNEELLKKGVEKILDIDNSMDRLSIKDKSFDSFQSMLVMTLDLGVEILVDVFRIGLECHQNHQF